MNMNEVVVASGKIGDVDDNAVSFIYHLKNTTFRNMSVIGKNLKIFSPLYFRFDIDLLAKHVQIIVLNF